MRVGSVSGVGSVVFDRAVCDHALALGVVLKERRVGTRGRGKRKITYSSTPPPPSETPAGSLFRSQSGASPLRGDFLLV